MGDWARGRKPAEEFPYWHLADEEDCLPVVTAELVLVLLRRLARSPWISFSGEPAFARALAAGPGSVSSFTSHGENLEAPPALLTLRSLPMSSIH